MSMPSALNDADNAYRSVKAIAAKTIAAEKITTASLAYARVRALAVRTMSCAEKIPTLQTAIMDLPTELIKIMDVTPAMEALTAAVAGLAAAIMDALSAEIAFEISAANY